MCEQLAPLCSVLMVKRYTYEVICSMILNEQARIAKNVKNYDVLTVAKDVQGRDVPVNGIV